MPLGAIRSVYTVANDMDLMRAFYEEAWSFRWHSGIVTSGVSSRPGKSRLP
jgi:hypothetical protein